MRMLGDHAVVLGGSLAGLLTARALSDFYSTVTVVERDPLTDSGRPRRGVAQGWHAHALLGRGGQVMDEFFPGLLDELVASGVPAGRELAELSFAPGGHLLSGGPGNAGSGWVQPSRPFLENALRARVRSLPTVTIRDAYDVIGPVHQQGVVSGVRIQARAAAGKPQTVPADLVVDATGRGARTPSWLTEMGYEPPAEDRLQVDLAYASRWLRLPAEPFGREKAFVHGACADRPRLFVLFAVEGDRWVLTLGGYGPVALPPTDEPGFLAFLRSVAPARVADRIEQADASGPITGYRFPTSVRRRYERVRRFPKGLLVIGDAICSFNPAYGQGMTVAALEAKALHLTLAGGDADLAGRYFRAAAKPVDIAWQMAVGGDLALPYVPGPRSVGVRLTNRHVARVLRAAETDPELANQFLRVCHLIDSPTALLRPAVLRRAWRTKRSPRGEISVGSTGRTDGAELG